jgi:CDP-diacylglycerol--glycerol-3-phosphate 3-phosphatidyltransferase
MIAAELSDLADGPVARRSARVSNFGKILDPMADCVYRGAVFIAFVANGWMPVWMLAIILWRDLAVSYLREIAELRSETLAARASGKWKAIVQGIAQVSIAAMAAWYGPEHFFAHGYPVQILLAVATLVTAYSLIDYLAGVIQSSRRAQASGANLPPRLSLLSAAHVISLGRVILAPAILLLLARNTRGTLLAALAIACVAVISDVLDGYVARRRGASDIGRYVDAACDAIFNLAVFLGFFASGWLPASWFAAICFAEVIVPYLGTFAKQMRQPFGVRWSARLKTTLHPLLQIGAIGIALTIPGPEHRDSLIALALGAAVAVSIFSVLDHAAFTVWRGRQKVDRPA